MLDIRVVRENPEYVKERVRLRGGDHWMLVDKVLECDVKRRNAETEKQALSSERNSSSKLIGQMMKEGRREEAEELKKKLEAQGLFDPAHKKPLPKFPGTIGIITSSAGAAVHDMLRILRKRYVEPSPCQWQGKDKV